MISIHNPILRGFNPDPSIIRVDEDYYIATSTFEWFPGVQIHHSKDLVNWTLVARPLNRLSQLDMAGNPDSCGVWAPCLSYHNGTFYLVYSNVRSFDGVWKDTPNYLVTTNDILGKWSEPLFLSSSGFDGSLFHDDDGRKWFTSMLIDHRQGLFFGGIILQEYDEAQQKLVGPVHYIFEGTELGCTEAPHLYKRNGYYYLIMAEGGTEYGHAVSLARAKNITGPYELHPENPVVTTRHNPKAALQKCGHADIVETPDGKWYIVFLLGRPLSEKGRCPLGRETGIEEVEWRDDGWLYLKHGGREPRLQFDIPAVAHAKSQPLQKDDFEQQELGIHFQSLRIPIEESWCTLSAKASHLRLYGQESLNSLFRQSLIARRIQDFHIEASVCVAFSPKTFQQTAGLTAYYNTGHWYYLYLHGAGFSTPEHNKVYIQLTSSNNFNTIDLLKEPIELEKHDYIYFKLTMNGSQLQFYYAVQQDNWVKIGPVLDGSILSDDYVRDGSARYRPAFTGAFVGLCCQDLSGQRLHADFDWFEYKEIS